MPPNGSGVKSGQRSGVILLVVVSLLTLFALIGLSFVLYAESQANSSRIYREAGQYADDRIDIPYDKLMNYFLGQLVFGVESDPNGVQSVLRSHNMSNLIYGSNPLVLNNNAFNGAGPLHYQQASLANNDDYNFPNFMYFQADGFVRDAQRYGPARTNPTAPLNNPYTGGENVPYTYPDRTNMFLGAMRADGTVLVPSFHRDWITIPLDPNNLAWYDTTNPLLKYQTMRPRPVDQLLPGETWIPGVGPSSGRTNFFPPPGLGGDVKSLIGSPGQYDSIWLDLGYPFVTLSNGMKFKPLFAAFIVDLDNRVNVNVLGNIKATNAGGHGSNQGWGKWEGNLAQVMIQGGGTEWRNLFVGNGALRGRYGADLQPNTSGTIALSGNYSHSYAPADVDGSDETTGNQTGPIVVPQPIPNGFPFFPNGYGNGSNAERTNHPSLFNVFQPAGDDQIFNLADMKKLLYTGSVGPSAATSLIGQLCPQNINDPRIRNLITTHSFDLDWPGLSPWLYDFNNPLYTNVGSPDLPPTVAGPGPNFPPQAQRGLLLPALGTDFTADWRSNVATVAGLSRAIGRVNLNRFLPPYPHMGSGTNPSNYSSVPMIPPSGPGNSMQGIRFDGPLPIQAQWQAAESARIQLADDIYRRLLAVTGVATPNNPANPSDVELLPRRWLAQLAVNMVDYIDEDDIMTPFQFYTTPADGLAPGQGNAQIIGGSPNELMPRYWVYGTELPRVVLNEVFAEANPTMPPKAGNYVKSAWDVKFWAELHNPLPTAPGSNVQPQDYNGAPLVIQTGPGGPAYSPYTIVIADNNSAAGGPLYSRVGNNDNVLGTPNQIRAQTNTNDFNNPPVTIGGPLAPNGASVSPGTYFLVGANGSDSTNSIAAPRVPKTTPITKTANMEYVVQYDPATTSWSLTVGGPPIADIPAPPPLTPPNATNGLTVLLRRLANPYRPFNAVTNPFVTVDYIEQVVPNLTVDKMGNQRTYASRGKMQPYASDLTTQIKDQAPVGGSTSAHTLGIQNNAVGGNPAAFNWLVHLDRKPISPVELMQVSGFHPHQLTHQFIAGGVPYQHRVDWFNQGNRLHRIFECLTTDGRSSGVWAGGKIPGKINLNTIWDIETFRAICDAQPGNSFYVAGTPNQIVDQIFNQLMSTRTPGGAPAGGDRPFKSLAAAPWGGPGDPQYPGSAGIDDTFFRAGGAGRLFDVPGQSHPYLTNQLATKIFNNVTTRSNTFAVWLTIGFFEVIQDTDPVTGQAIYPVKLGAEINLATGRNIRHHMFAVVDRSAMNLEAKVGNSNNGVNAGTRVPPQHVTGVQLSNTVQLVNGTTVPYQIQPGTILVVDWGTPLEEMVVVTQTQTVGPNSFQANFTRPHSPGFAITLAGNPMPQGLQFDFRNQKYTSTVPLVIPID